MRKKLLSLLLAAGLLSAGCQKDIYDRSFPPAETDVVINANHPMRDSVRAIIDKYVADGLPGVQVAVKNADGWYLAGGGFAKVEDGSPISNGMVGWYFSLTKTYTAALVMHQWERERLNLDAPIVRYLPAQVGKGITGSDQITVRQLLNHSSGIVNVTELPAFQLGQLNHPLEQPSVTERLEMVYCKPLLFAPGTDFSYSNTNYLLLTVMLEQISGKTYAQLLREEIIEPLGLNQTYFDLASPQLEQLPFPNYYFDRYANGQLENITAWNAALGNSCAGYGGIAGTAADAIRFLEALVKGRVVSAASLQEMRTWIQGAQSTQPDYGLGLEYYQFGNGGAGQYGHEGDGIGCTTQVMYVPENDTYLYINITAGRQLFGPYLFKTTDMKRELCGYVARWRR